MTVTIDVSPGELVDKITILELKTERIAEPQSVARADAELRLLRQAHARAVGGSPDPDIVALTTELKAINAALWDIEDALRDCERAGDFGPRFVELARSVYRTNDRRSATKNRLNAVLSSTLVEVKSYAAY